MDIIVCIENSLGLRTLTKRGGRNNEQARIWKIYVIDVKGKTIRAIPIYVIDVKEKTIGALPIIPLKKII